jgi:hypothetical protein
MTSQTRDQCSLANKYQYDPAPLWRKSLLEPGWSPVPNSDAKDSGYGITLVDFAAEILGLSTLWLGTGFFVNSTDHFF